MSNICALPFPIQFFINYSLFCFVTNLINFCAIGTTHFIRLRRYGSRYFFSDDLKEFRRTHDIDDSVIMRFFSGDKNTTFEVDVIGPILGQHRPRSVLATRRHIFTADVIEHMMQQSLPLVMVC